MCFSVKNDQYYSYMFQFKGNTISMQKHSFSGMIHVQYCQWYCKCEIFDINSRASPLFLYLRVCLCVKIMFNDIHIPQISLY